MHTIEPGLKSLGFFILNTDHVLMRSSSGPKIVISHNFQRLHALLTGLGDKRQIQKATNRAIRRTLPGIQRLAFTEIKAKRLLKMKASEIKLRARSYMNAGAGKPVSEQYGKIWITSKGESLARFYAKRVRAGTSKLTGSPLFKVQVNQFGASALAGKQDKAFLVKRSGGSGGIVFARIAGKRLPIEKLYGPGMTELLSTTGIFSRLVSYADVRFQKEFDDNLKFYAASAVQKANGVK